MNALNTVTLHSRVPDGATMIVQDVASERRGNLSGVGACDAGDTATWSLGPLGVGASRTVTMTVVLSADAIHFPDGTLIFNRAWVLGDGGAVAEQAVAVDSSPSLTVAFTRIAIRWVPASCCATR